MHISKSMMVKLLLVAMPLFIGACVSSTTQQGAVGADRKQMMLISSEQMNQGAEKSYQQVLQKAQSQGALNRDVAMLNRVRAIAARLTPVTATFRQDAPGWKWEVNVLSSNELNAWCMPGGKIAFYSGIIEKLNLTDDEIAAIMGHEISHALREHSREAASEEMRNDLLLQGAAKVFGMGDTGQKLAGIATKYAFELPHSRGHETEADRIGVELAARGGYDPRAAIGLWQKMTKVSGGQPPQWMSTHPSHEDRIKDLTEYAQRVLPLYEAVRPVASRKK